MSKQLNFEPSESDVTKRLTDLGFSYDIVKNVFRGDVDGKIFIATKLTKFNLIVFASDYYFFAISYFDFLNLKSDYFNEFLGSLGEVRIFDAADSGKVDHANS